MAKQVSNVFIRLGIENFEGIEKLKGAFRELDKSIGPSAESIDRSILAIRNYSRAAAQSEQLIRGQIEAFKGLRSQLEIGSTGYSELTTEITQLQTQLRGSTAAVDSQREALLNNFNQNTRNIRALREHVGALTELRNQTRNNSTAFTTLSNDISTATDRLQNAEQTLTRLRTALSRGFPATAAGVRGRITDLTEGIETLRATIDDIDTRTKEERKLATTIEARAAAEEQLNRALAERRQLQFGESVREGRQRVRTDAEAFAGGVISGGFLSIRDIGQRMGPIPNTLAGINQELGEMRERFQNAVLEGTDFIAVLDRIDALNRRQNRATTQFQTPRQAAAAAVQARIEAQREIIQQSGFAQFSSDISSGAIAARAQTRQIKEVRAAFAAIETAYESMSIAVQSAEQRTLQQELNAAQLIEEGDQRAHAATMQRKQQEANAGERWFKEELARLDILSQQRKAAASAMGLGGRELSPLYQRITGLATAGVAQQQQFMGRSATAVYTDVVDAFNAGSRPVDLKNKSTYIGDSIAQGVSEGAKDSPAILSGARYFAHKVLVTYKREIASELSRYGDILFGGPGATFNLARADVAAGRQKLGVADTAIGLRSPGGFPIEGMMGPSSPLGGGPRPPTPPSNGGGFDKLNADITKFGALNRRSIDDLQGLKATLDQVHAGLSPLDADYKKINRAIEQQNLLIDKQLAKRQQGGGRGLGGRQLTQIGGAAISGGIFGGAEGFLGGVAGGIFGGVGGSFAGAAVGAQLGMLRQQLGGTAEYAAQIGKLQIALRGVAGTQDNYNQAINAAAAATRDLNVPQMEAIQGITRLSAAVLGAGGTIGDANFAFRAISESIKATGGNAEQVDGAMLALTQVFSKGKVSAEELNQIAERLPGTFTLFAQATGKSGPELQKALQQGQVGLNDLMKFLELASRKNAETAQNIAGSSEEAGARMKIAFDQMRLEVGRALQPIGAELQNTFAVFVKDITPAVIGAAQGIGGALKTLLDNAKVIEVITKLGLAFVGTNLAIKAFVALQGPLAVASLAIKTFFGNVSVQATMAKQQIKSFAASIAAPLIISLAVVGIDGVLSALREVEDARKRAEGAGTALQGAEFVAQAGGRSLTTRDLGRLLQENAIETNKVQDTLKRAREEALGIGQGFLGANQTKITLAEARTILKDSTGYTPRDVKVASQLVEYETKLATLQSRREAIQQLMRTAKPPAPLPNAPATAAGAGETEAERAAKQAAETERRLAQEGIKLQMDGQLKAFEYAVELDRRRYELQKQLSDEASAHEIANLQGGARTIAQAYATYRSRIAEIERGLVEAAQNTSLERERLRTSQAVEAVTAGTGMQGRYRQGSIGPTSTGPHFDIKQVGGGRFGRTDLDQYVQVNGRPLSTGTTLPGGTFDAPRTGRARHGGWDYAFPPGAALELKGGAQWVNLGPSGGNGDMATFKTLDGKTYTILHGKFERTAAAVTAPTAQGRSQLLREQKTAGKTDYAGLGVSQAEGLQQAGALVAEQQKTSAFRTLVDTYTQSIRDQNYELSNSNTLNVERNRLLAAGASSKYIDYAMRLVEIRRTEADMLDRINLEEKDPEKRAEQIRNLNALYAETRDLLRQNYELSTAFDNSLGLREGAQRYVESIGTLREATAGLAQQGFKGIEDSIVSLATTGTANFAQFATSLLNDMARIIIQQFVMKQLAEAIGNLFGGPKVSAASGPINIGYGGGFMPPAIGSANGNVFGANGIVPYAMGGIVNRPTLFPFANGGAIGTGLMGEAGPEAIMPLTRGANGKLGVMAAGGGTTNVVVNVDAKGNSQVEGREDTASQLGRVVAAAVQQELVKQQRPGGLLAR